MLMITFPGTFVTGETWWVLGSLTKWQNLRVPGHIFSLALLRKRKIKTRRKPKLNPQYIPVMTWVNSKNERGMNEINVAPIQGTAVWPEPGDSICFPATLTRCCQRERANVQPSIDTHPAPCFDSLVHKVREGFPGDVPPRALRDVQIPILQHDLALADHHQGRPTALHALEDVVLQRLQRENQHIRQTYSPSRACWALTGNHWPC